MGFVQHMQKSIDQNRALRKNHTSLKKQLTDKDLKSNLHQDLKYKKVSSEELENMKNEIQKKIKKREANTIIHSTDFYSNNCICLFSDLIQFC